MSTAKLELSLDDIVKQNKKSFSKSRGAGGARGRGGNRGGRGAGAKGGVKRLNSQSPMKNRGSGKFNKQAITSPAPSSGPVRLVVSNLDFGVNDQDINELFSRCGKIVKASVHYDSQARSQGTAEVIYRGIKEATAAVGEYNGRLLDGRAMKVQIVGGQTAKPMSARVGSKPAGNQGGRTNGASARGRGGKRGGRGGRAPRAAPPTKEDLDKQMEEYKMQTDTA